VSKKVWTQHDLPDGKAVWLHADEGASYVVSSSPEERGYRASYMLDGQIVFSPYRYRWLGNAKAGIVDIRWKRGP
jgi:hypothetical protein